VGDEKSIESGTRLHKSKFDTVLCHRVECWWTKQVSTIHTCAAEVRAARPISSRVY